MELFERIKKLSAAHGPSGDEGGIRAAIEEMAAPYADEDGIGFVDAGISDSYVWKNHVEINEAKKRFAEEDPDHNVYIDTIAERLSYKFEPTGNPDPYHYDADGEIELGRLFGLALLENFLD